MMGIDLSDVEEEEEEDFMEEEEEGLEEEKEEESLEEEEETLEEEGSDFFEEEEYMEEEEVYVQIVNFHRAPAWITPKRKHEPSDHELPDFCAGLCFSHHRLIEYICVHQMKMCESFCLPLFWLCFKCVLFFFFFLTGMTATVFVSSQFFL